MITIDNTVLSQLKEFSLYSNCGKQFQNEVPPFTIEQLFRIEDVNRNLQSLDWENFEIECLNALRSYLRNYPRNKRQQDELLLWNKITDVYKKELTFLESIAKELVETSSVDTTMIASFNWITLIMCMENHFQKLNTKIPTVFLHMLPIYAAGHIPCGWKGSIERRSDGKSMNLSEGTLLIY